MTMVKCPHCSDEFNVEAMAVMNEDTRMSIGYKPQGKTLMSAASIGKSLNALQKIFNELSKQNGDPRTTALIEKIRTNSEGTLIFDLICARTKSVKPVRSKAVSTNK